MRIAEGRQPNGSGFAELRTVAAGGPCIAYGEGAGDWWVHFALASVIRLRIITWLCTHPGEHKRTAIERDLRLYPATGEDALMAMRSCGLVAGRIVYHTRQPVPKPRTRSTCFWSATQEGRRYLWRYGWVTGRLVPGVWTHDTFHGSTDACPCEALAADAAQSLLRPRAMAVAYILWTSSPIAVRDIARVLSLPTGDVHGRLVAWWKRGWVQRRRVERPGHARPDRNPLQWRWAFTREGLQAMERHCHALRWAAQHSGYQVPPDDRFLLGDDRVHWYTVEFTTDR
jgi:hypothetical protein